MPIISMKPLVPSSPGPPKDPKSFWAPWPAMREPCARRTIAGAVSFTLDPLELAVFIFAPSVAFSLGPCLPRAAVARGGGPARTSCIPETVRPHSRLPLAPMHPGAWKGCLAYLACMELSDVRVVPSGRLAGGVATPSRAALGGISRGRPPVPRLVFDLALRISDDLEDGRLD